VLGPKQIGTLLRETFREWQDDKASQLAAALSYYTAVSIAPLLVIVIAIAGLALGTQAAQDELIAQITGLVGAEGGAIIKTIVENADRPGLATLAGILGAITLVWSSSNVFSQLQSSLNTIWGVEAKPGGSGISAIVNTIRERFLSFGMVVVIGFMLLVSLVVSAALTAVGTYFSGYLEGLGLLWQIVNFVVSFGVITLLFALMFKVLPDLRIAWRDVWLGAAVTALLFVVGKSLIGLYLGNQSIGSAYGAAGSLVVFLLWVYYSAQIFFFGAEFTQVYATRYGAGVTPNKGARYIDDRPPGGDAEKPGKQRSEDKTRGAAAPAAAQPAKTRASSRMAPRIVPWIVPQPAKIQYQPFVIETRSDTMKKVQNPISMINTDEIVAHAEQLQEAAQALAQEMRGQTEQAVHRTAEQAKASASKLAGEARRTVEAKVVEQRAGVANRLDNVAAVLRKTSKDLHGAHEDALAHYTGTAAAQFERLATALRPAPSNSLPARILRFAKRHPIVFVLTSIAAFFAARMAYKNVGTWGPVVMAAVSSGQSWNGDHSSLHNGAKLE
jgi:membrane protein